MRAAKDKSKGAVSNTRGRNRIKAVLPVRVTASDIAGGSYSDLAHTLDITETGARLGAVRRPLEVGSLLILQYKQHRAEFRVVWSKPMPHSHEHQVGLQALAQKDVWGLAFGLKLQPTANIESYSDQPDIHNLPA